MVAWKVSPAFAVLVDERRGGGACVGSLRLRHCVRRAAASGERNDKRRSAIAAPFRPRSLDTLAVFSAISAFVAAGQAITAAVVP